MFLPYTLKSLVRLPICGDLLSVVKLPIRIVYRSTIYINETQTNNYYKYISNPLKQPLNTWL